MLKKVALLLLLVSLFGVACKRIVTKHKVYEFGEKPIPTPVPIAPMSPQPMIISPKTPETLPQAPLKTPESKPATESKPMVESKPHVETKPTVESKPAKPPATHSPSAW